MTEHHIRIRCDECKCHITIETSDSGVADRYAERKGWIFHRWDMYGNQSEFCCVACRDKYLAKMEAM